MSAKNGPPVAQIGRPPAWHSPGGEAAEGANNRITALENSFEGTTAATYDYNAPNRSAAVWGGAAAIGGISIGAALTGLATPLAAAGLAGAVAAVHVWLWFSARDSSDPPHSARDRDRGRRV